MTRWRDVTALYQIYPRSFYDSSGDGVGDLAGITEKLEYLKYLGVDAFWLSPVYASPQQDCGYDVSDYQKIDPMFGTMADMDELIGRAHDLGLKVMMDFVANHTSDQHEWFQQARLSKENPYRDYYVWKDPKADGREPTNWISLAGGKSWTLEPLTGQYYLHSFLPSQPDLNWDNPKVREEMRNVLRFWLNRGVDGFRVDAAWPISKTYLDDPLNQSASDQPGQYGSYQHTMCKNGPNMLAYMKDMSDVMEEYDDAFMVFEYYTDEQLGDEVGEYVNIAAINPATTAPFVFDLFRLPWHANLRAARIRALYDRIPNSAMPVNALGNHDQTRIASRFGETQARALAVVQMALPGLPTVYYGEELGMTDFIMPEGVHMDNFKEGGGMGGRDPERTPMQWTSAPHAGFTVGEPWLPVPENFKMATVEGQAEDPTSFLSLYRRLLAIRKNHLALRQGTYSDYECGDGYVWAFQIVYAEDRILVLANFDSSGRQVSIEPGKILVSSYADNTNKAVNADYKLQPYEAIIVKIEKGD